MSRYPVIAAFILLIPVFLVNSVSSSVHKTNTNTLKIRAGNHPGFLRIVFEGDGTLISKGTVEQKGRDIIASFTDTDFSINEKSLPIAYRTDKDAVIFSLEKKGRFKTFSLKNPDRLVIDVYQDKKRKKEKAKSNTKTKPETKAEDKAEIKAPARVSEKKHTEPENKTDIANSVEGDDDEAYIPEKYKKLWSRLTSGNPYGVLKELPSHKPGDAESMSAYHYMYGEAYSELKKYFPAIEHFRLAYIYASNEKLKELALLKRADLYQKIKFFYEARADYLVFIRDFPSSGYIERAHLGLARSLSALGLYKEALKHYEKAGKTPEALFGLANTLQRLGKTEDAKKAYDKAMLADKDYPLISPETYFLIGENMRLSGKITGARKQLSSIDFGPFKDKASISLGLIAMEESDTEEAIRKFKSASRSGDAILKARALFNLSLAYIEEGRFEEAISSLEEIRHNYIDSSMYKDTLLLLSRLYREQGDFKLSVSLLMELVYGKEPPAETFKELEKVVLETSERSKEGNGNEVEFVSLWNEVGPLLIDETREEFLVMVAQKLRYEGRPFLTLSSWLVEHGTYRAKVKAAVDLADYYAGIGNIGMSRKYISIANLANAVSTAKEFKESKDDILRVEAKIKYAMGDQKAAFEKIRAIRKFRESDLEQLGNIISRISSPDSKDMKEAVAFYEKKLNESVWDADYYIKLADILYLNNEKNRSLKYYRIAYQKNPADEWAAYRLGQGAGMPESKNMFSRLQEGDTMLSRLAKTRLFEMDLMNKVKEVY
ncbi:MAG TPA: tetratricopeptide repeat protein [Nitrospirae bacterium]|nr:tetratricopeptide repeat protein [bacterium BMS3Abin06]HDH10928.1 tetratricopeptide repeat protein [Nitrospirota bacterium]HDZ00422.1 tetratricopeptide repeat protein [Nitrospirota bacterium]